MSEYLFLGIVLAIVLCLPTLLIYRAASTESIRRAAPVALVLAALLTVSVPYYLYHRHQNFLREQADEHPHYKAVITGYTLIAENVVRVRFTVTNDGNAPGSPTCLVIVNPTNQYLETNGIGTYQMPGTHTLKPGASYRVVENVDVFDGTDPLNVVSSSVSVGQC